MFDKLGEILSGGFGKFQNPLRSRQSAALTGLGLGLIGAPSHQIGQRALGGLLAGAGAYGALSGEPKQNSVPTGLLDDQAWLDRLNFDLANSMGGSSMGEIHPSTRFDKLRLWSTY